MTNAHTKKTNLPAKERMLSPVVRFVLTFVGGLLVGGFAYAWTTAEYHDALFPLMTFTAQLTSAVVSLFGSDVFCFKQMVTFNGFSVEIIDECTGLLEMLIYSVAVLSFSASIKQKLIGLAAGIPAIYLFNLLRIIVLLIVGSYSQEWFDFLHLYLWQVTLIVMIAAVWIGWLYLVVYREKRTVPVSS
jgi:archaeosortase B (VPXXXP-CTERM-specific)